MRNINNDVEKLKICHVLAAFPYREQLTGEVSGGRYRVGGIGQYVLCLSTELARLGHRITIVSPKAPQHSHLSEIEREGVDILRVSPIANIYSCSLPLGILGSLKPNEYDIVHAHTPVPAIAELAALRINGKIPFILGYHNDVVKAGSPGRLLGNIYGFTMGPFLLKRADAIITLTRSLAQNSRRLADYSHKVKVVPGAVNTERFHPGLDGNRIRKKYGLRQEAKVILFVGILDAYKGCDYLIKAMPAVASRVPEAQLILIGTGPMTEELKSIASRLGTEANITFAGFVPDEDLPDYYAASDVFVLPSVSSEEGFGLVQLEAMASGKPVVTTTIPGVCEVDAQEVATIHVPPKNMEALAEAIVRILQNSELAARLGIDGRKLIENRYTWPKVARDMQEVYSQALGKKHHGKVGQ